jgi:PadR family transcriptional regulator PadR
MVTSGSEVGSQLRKGVVEFAVLALLQTAPMYGWQLADELISRGRFIGSIGTLYPVLSRLRAKGWVSTYEEASASGPARRYYIATQTGLQSLNSFRGQWREFSWSLSTLMGEEKRND